MDTAFVQAVGLISVSLAYCDMLVLFLYPFFPAIPLVTVPSVFFKGFQWTFLRFLLSLPAIGLVLMAGYLVSVNNASGVIPLFSFLFSGTCTLLTASILYYLVVDGYKQVRPPMGVLRAVLDLLTDSTATTASLLAPATKSLNTALISVFQALFKLILLVIVLRQWTRFKNQKSTPNIYMGPDGTLIREEHNFTLISTVFQCAMYSVFLYLLLSALCDIAVALISIVLKVRLVEMWSTPFASSSPRDFWGRRWNTVFRALYNQSILRGLLQAAKAWERVKQVQQRKKHDGSSLKENEANKDGSGDVDVDDGDSVVDDGFTSNKNNSKKSNTASNASKRKPTTTKSQQGSSKSSNTSTTSNDFLYSFVSVNIVFLLSGLLHEYICYCTFGQVTGENLLFFVLQANICVAQAYLEKKFPKLSTALTSESIAPAITLTLLLMISTSYLFFAPFIRHNFFEAELSRFLSGLLL